MFHLLFLVYISIFGLIEAIPLKPEFSGNLLDVLYLAGGGQVDQSGRCFEKGNLAIAYDFQNKRWCKVKRSLPAELYLGSIADFQNQLVFAGGANATTTCENIAGPGFGGVFTYDVSADKFSPIEQYPELISLDARAVALDSEILAVFSGDGKVLLYENGQFSRGPDSQIDGIGGFFQVAKLNQYLVFSGGNQLKSRSVVKIFDSKSGNWSEGPSLNTFRYSHASIAVGNSVFVCGGNEAKNTCERLDLKEDGSFGDKWVPIAPMTSEFRADFSLVEWEGRILAVSGDNVFSVEAYDIGSDKWTPNQLAPYPVATKIGAGTVITKLPESALDC